MRKIKRCVCLLLALLVVWTVPAAAVETAEKDDPLSPWVIVRYQLDAYAVHKNDTVDLTVWLQNPGQPAGYIPKVIPVVSSFNGVTSVSMDTKGDELIVTFGGARYQGVGQAFAFRVDNQELELTVRECVEYTEPEPMEPAPDETEPVLQVGRGDQPGPIAAGQTQNVSLWVHNLTDKALQEVVATVTPSGDLMIADNSVTYPLIPLRGGDVAFFDVVVRGLEQIGSAAQSLEISLHYTYEKNGATLQGSSTHTVPLSAQVTEPETDTPPMAASVPNLIVSSYDFGGEKLFAGTAFDLTLQFRNTSAIKRVENIVMTVKPDSALAITSSSNSFHYASLDPGGEQLQTINLQVLPDAPSAPATVSLHFSYEYVDNDSRQSVTAEQSISLPVYQLDRFELTQENAYVDAWQFEESFLTLQYVNKGKSTVYNVSAELVGEIGAMSRIQNIGNVEAGKSGTIDFIITPEMAGQTSCMLVITYEDDAMQVMTKEFTFDVFVNEAYVPEFYPEEEMPGIMEEAEPQRPGWVIPAAAAAAVALVVLVIVLAVRKKKKAGRVESFVFADGTEDDHGAS